MAKKTSKKAAKKADPESEVTAAIAAMPKADRDLAERLHEVIVRSAPGLTPKLWYGQPAYAKGGKVVCFFRGAEVDQQRFMTLGFNDGANLDEGNLWPVAYALTKLTAADEKKIGGLVKKAAG